MERSGGGFITLAPSERWEVDQQCMVLHQGYLADWVGYNKGDVFQNTSQFEVTYEVDYGRPFTKDEALRYAKLK